MTDLDAIDFFRDNAFVADPYPYFEFLRSECPVRREPHHGVVMVTGYEEAISVFHDTTTFSSCNSVTGPLVQVPLAPYNNSILRDVDDVRTLRSFCRICTAVCGILVDVSGDQVVRVRGDQDHPLSHGYTCAKGRALPQMHHHPARLEHPLIRVGDSLQPTTWNACLDDLATRLRAVVDDHGPNAIGVFFGSGVGMDAAGYRMAEALHAAIGTPARFSPLTIDGTAKVLVSHQVGGFHPPPRAPTEHRLRGARVPRTRATARRCRR